MICVQYPIVDVHKLFTKLKSLLYKQTTHLLYGGKVFNDWVYYM